MQACSVSYSADGDDFAPADTRTGPCTAFGSALNISLPSKVKQDAVGTSVRVRIDYETPQGAQLSSGFQHTRRQGRSILTCLLSARLYIAGAWYRARMLLLSKYVRRVHHGSAPLVALMSASAENIGSFDSTGESISVYSFKQDVPLPAYLIALAVGDLECRDIGPRTRVWSGLLW